MQGADWIRFWLAGSNFAPPPWWGPRDVEAYYRMEFELRMREIRPVQEHMRLQGRLPYMLSFATPLKYVGTTYDGHAVVFLDWEADWGSEEEFRWHPVFGLDWGSEAERVGRVYLENDLYAYYINGRVEEYTYAVKKLTEGTAVKYAINRTALSKYLAEKLFFDHHSLMVNTQELVCTLWEEVGARLSFDFVASVLGTFEPPPESEIVPWLMVRDTYVEELKNAVVEDEFGKNVHVMTEAD